MNFQRFIKYWLPLVLWLGVIFLGSTDLMSAEHTSRFIVRKCAHVSEYAVLALLLLRAAICMTNLKRPMSILYPSVWVACLFVAATDEFHQTFVAPRGASVRDIMIDSGGAILGLLIGAAFVMSRSTRREKNTCRAVNG